MTPGNDTSQEKQKRRKTHTLVKTSKKAIRIGTFLGWVIRIVVWTMRKKCVNHSLLKKEAPSDFPVIVCVWHNQIFGLPSVVNHFFPKWEGSVLTSPSHDGAALAAAIRVFGHGAVRGSSSRRGFSAMMELKRLIDSGLSVCITPDGPKGPCYSIQPGALKLASITGSHIIPVRVKYSCAFRLKTWDRFLIPLPFSKITVTFEKELAVSQNLTDDELEACQRKLESVMRMGLDDIE